MGRGHLSVRKFDYDKKVLIYYEDLTQDPGKLQQQIADAQNLEIKSDSDDFHNKVVTEHDDIKLWAIYGL